MIDENPCLSFYYSCYKYFYITIIQRGLPRSRLSFPDSGFDYNLLTLLVGFISGLHLLDLGSDNLLFSGDFLVG